MTYPRDANSTVEYSAFNRLVPGSNPGRPIKQGKIKNSIEKTILALNIYQVNP
jgi:hypothetical protein